jgi:hypothetical protein
MLKLIPVRAFVKASPDRAGSSSRFVRQEIRSLSSRLANNSMSGHSLPCKQLPIPHLSSPLKGSFYHIVM